MSHYNLYSLGGAGHALCIVNGIPDVTEMIGHAFCIANGIPDVTAIICSLKCLDESCDCLGVGLMPLYRRFCKHCL